MEKILIKKSVPRWVKKLTGYDVYGPIKNGGDWHYQSVKRPEEMDLDYAQAVEAPKKIVFPQREVFFTFKQTGRASWENTANMPEEKPAIVFGVRPCEARALTLTDRVFGGDFSDPYYWRRRNNTVLVGLSCNTPPSTNCFCLSVNGSPNSGVGMDILMTDLGETFLLAAETEKGERLVRENKELFAEVESSHKTKLKEIHSAAEAQIKRSLKEVEAISTRLKDMFESPIWEDESFGCIRCGICTYLCPTCHCFDINDEVTQALPMTGNRVRTWDNCQFPDFTMHSSGHNPRPDKASRLRQRLLHKFLYFPENEGAQQCTGCGRCITLCPVGIDIIEILNKVKNYG